MGCAGSKPIDPADFIVPQDEPEEPMLVRLTSCASSFVELSSKPRPKSEDPIQLVTWEGLVPNPKSTIENFDTANNTTAIVQSMDYQGYAKSRPFVISFFDANRKLVAVLSGGRPPQGLGYLDQMKADTAVLYNGAARRRCSRHRPRDQDHFRRVHAPCSRRAAPHLLGRIH